MPIDYKKYPPTWKTEIVPRILKRANNKCEFCGLENHSIITACKIWVKVDFRDSKGHMTTGYRLKTFWLETESDVERFDRFSMAGYFKNVKVVLTVAHLDHDEENWDVRDDRLKALCQYCHLNYDAKEKYRRVMEG